jgi:hypothetical protein
MTAEALACGGVLTPAPVLLLIPPIADYKGVLCHLPWMIVPQEEGPGAAGGKICLTSCMDRHIDSVQEDHGEVTDESIT